MNKKDCWMNGRMDRPTEGQTNEWAERQTDRHRDKETCTKKLKLIQN
jgi:hypothetical protein